MRIFLVIFLCLYSANAFAQAADKDAIDLTTKMDSVAGPYSQLQRPVGNLDVSPKKDKHWEDFEINYTSDANFGKMRYGGPLIFQETNVPHVIGEPSFYADFDGDGIGDLITHNIIWYKGKKDYPYFDTTSHIWFKANGYFGSEHWSFAAIDYDGDGYTDLLSIAYDGGPFGRLFLFKGAKDLSQRQVILPSDSITIPNPPYVPNAVCTKFGKSLPPMIVFNWTDKNDSVKPVYRIGLIRHSTPVFHDDSIVWISTT
jgi:hypothetical protein